MNSLELKNKLQIENDKNKQFIENLISTIEELEEYEIKRKKLMQALIDDLVSLKTAVNNQSKLLTKISMIEKIVDNK